MDFPAHFWTVGLQNVDYNGDCVGGGDGGAGDDKMRICQPSQNIIFIHHQQICLVVVEILAPSRRNKNE